MGQGQYSAADITPSPAPTQGQGRYSTADITPQLSGGRGGRGGGGQGQASDAASHLSGNAVTDLIGGIADTTVKTIPAVARTVKRVLSPNASPQQRDKALYDATAGPMVDQWRKAGDAWRRGEHVEAAGRAVAGSLPLVGPAAAGAADTIGGELAYDDKDHPERPTGMVREPQVARGIGQGIGVALSVSPKNVIEPVVTKAAGLVGKIPVPERITPEGLYQSSLRPGLSRKNLPKIDAKVQTGLREGIPVSRSGLQNTDAAIDSLNNEIAAKISDKSQQLGPVINPLDVTKPVNKLKPTFAEQVNPKEDLEAIDSSKREFLDKHSTPFTGPLQPQVTQAGNTKITNYSPPRPSVKTPLTLSEAQAEKQGTYRQLNKKYGELGSADIETQKALARGLKDEIAKRVPEISALNARDGALVELQTELEKMVAREGNKNVLGLVPAVMSQSHNPFGLAATLAMDNPAIKSRIAIILDRARNATSAPGVGRGAGTVAPAALVGSSQQPGPPKYARGGIIRKPTVATIAEDGPEAVIPIGPPRFRSPSSQLKHEANSEKYKIMNQAEKQSAPPRYKRN